MDFDLQALRAEFQDSTAEHLARMEERLLAFETCPPGADDIDEMFRGAHSIKGDAACVGFEVVAQVAHAMEDLLDVIRHGAVPYSPARGALLLRGVDEIRRLAAAPEAGARADRALLAALSAAPAAYHRAGPASAARAGVETAPTEEAAALEPVPGPSATSAHLQWAAGASTPTSGAAGGGPERGKEALSPAAHRQEAPAVCEPPPAPSAPDQTLRVGVRLLDRVLSLTSGIAIERARVHRLVEELPATHRGPILEAFRAVERLDHELQECVLAVRMVRLRDVFQRSVRTARDAALATGKLVKLVIEGGEVEVDTTIAENLADPLVHLVRNAVAHGIELPADRVLAGKPATGVITLRASHREGRITVEVQDDGAGIDREAVRQRAIEQGRDPGDAALDDLRLCDLLCAPGLTTARQVTDLAGRGVGMDVVRRNVDALRGTLTLASERGLGTTFRLGLPLTLMAGFEVRVGGDAYFVPLDAVEECIDLTDATGGTATSVGFFTRHGEPTPLVHLRDLLGLDRMGAGQGAALLLRDHETQLVLAVDALVGERQVVVSPLGELLPRGSVISGATTLPDGRVGLILDTVRLARGAHGALRGTTRTQRGKPPTSVASST